MEDSLVREKTIAFSIAQEILKTRVDIPPIPANGRKILDVVRQPKSKIDIPEFVKLVESDPGLFTKILRLANSPFYSEPEQIVSLRAAVTRIGLVETINSVCLHFFQEMLPKFPDIEGFTYNDFWAHSWVCAVANRRLGHPNLEMDILPGDLYMAGMLQGLGKLLLAIYFPNEFTRCVETAVQQECPLFEVEKQVFGTTDALVGSKVLHAWHLPSHICEAVAYHQTPELAPPEYIVISALTQYAHALAGLSEIGTSGDGRSLDLQDTFFGQKPTIKLAHPQVQQILIREIRKYVAGNKAESVLRFPNARQAFKNSTVVHRPAREYPKPIKTGKKGFFGWVKSVLGGN